MADKTWVGTDVGNEGDWSTAANWSPSGVPVAADNVRIPAGSAAISGGLNQSAVALGDVIVEDGYTNTIASSAADLQIDPDRFEFSGSGVAYIDLGTANIDVLVRKTAGAATGLRGLYLIGSNMAAVDIRSGKVGIATVHGTTATVADLRIAGGDVWAGEGTTLTTVELTDGTADIRCAATTLRISKGTLTTSEEGAITTVNLYSGTGIFNSSGTITTLNVNGGTADFLQGALSRTVTTLNLNPGGGIKYDPNVMTISTISEANAPIAITSTPV